MKKRMRDYSKEVFGSIVLLMLIAVTAVCQPAQPPAQQQTAGMPQVVQVEKPTATSIDPKNIPAPFHTASARRSSREVTQPADAKLYVPKGFKVNVYAEGGFTYPRWMALAPNGDVFLADSRKNSVIVLRDKNKDGVAEERFTWSSKLAQPFGMAFKKDWLFVANTDSVVRF